MAQEQACSLHSGGSGLPWHRSRLDAPFILGAPAWHRSRLAPFIPGAPACRGTGAGLLAVAQEQACSILRAPACHGTGADLLPSFRGLRLAVAQEQACSLHSVGSGLAQEQACSLHSGGSGLSRHRSRLAPFIPGAPACSLHSGGSGLSRHRSRLAPFIPGAPACRGTGAGLLPSFRGLRLGTGAGWIAVDSTCRDSLCLDPVACFNLRMIPIPYVQFPVY
ncbi:hypothetical protein NDU88_005365 [Pleurodeles waltl]|uniref:Uncharacterized protein n=1 Tax=Pleurodeles waltl TaxID=8319 RepID=A0AAV7MCM8_PLEWA|nr:hypothetical protein NDU88_005365 [Pleurodeles waltl]